MLLSSDWCGEVIGQCSRNLLFSLKLPSSTWGRGWEVACVCTRSLSCVQFFATPWTVAHQAALSMGFSLQDYWSGLHFPPPGNITNPRIEPVSPETPMLQVDSFLLSHRGSSSEQELIITFAQLDCVILNCHVLVCLLQQP